MGRTAWRTIGLIGIIGCLAPLWAGQAAPEGSAQDWAFYPFRLERVQAVNNVDLSLKASAPDKARPVLWWVKAPFRKPTSNGLFGKEEEAVLFQIEDDLEGVLAGKHGGAFAGRTTKPGERAFFFYLPDGAKPEEHLTAVKAKHEGYELTWSSKRDEAWTLYLEFLYPDGERMQFVKDLRVIHQLRAAGDAHEAERPIDHYAYFPNVEARAAFLKEIEGKGFAVTDQNRVDDPSNKNPFSVHLIRSCRIDLNELYNEQTLVLYRAAKKAGGDYDGWGSPVIQPAAPVPPKP